MIPVKQTKFGRGEGDCLPACVASILEIDLEDVPNFCAVQDSTWLDHFADWLAGRGLCAVHVAFVDSDPGVEPDPEGIDIVSNWIKRCRIGLAIVSGYTERGLSHSTVWLDGEPHHDPHPTPSPLLNVVSVIVISRRDPLTEVAHG